MRTLTFLLFCLMMIVPQEGSTETKSSFTDCNDFYHAHSYRSAVDCYEQLSTEGYSAELFYNLGNSYAQLGQTGHGVLNYLRGLAISPGDSDIKGNLEALKNEHGLFDAERTFTHKFTRLLSLSQWCWLLLTLFMCHIIVSFAVFRKKIINPKREWGLNLIFFLLGSLCIWSAFNHYQDWQKLVVINDTRLQVSPIDSGSAGLSIKQGRTVAPLKQYQEFTLVIDDSGRKGWVRQEDLVPIIIEKR
ncbi:MAG: hypothetical protein D6B25_13875 [Desulfobulbaceae bacterium]|nr:MAG: hypothetical protein D6B25_13875 [Desulfobulbaceae bacterium]